VLAEIFEASQHPENKKTTEKTKSFIAASYHAGVFEALGEYLLL
jgi:hypothetical protein